MHSATAVAVAVANPSRQGAVHVASDKARAVIENSQLKAMNFSQAPPSLLGRYFFFNGRCGEIAAIQKENA